MNAKKVIGPKDGGSYRDRVREKWRGRAPDWIMTLAGALDDEVAAGGSQTTLGKRLGIQPSVISGIIGKTYPGKLDRHEAAVRGRLMAATVTCPVLGNIGRDACATYQQSRFSTAAPHRARLHKACPTCPNNLDLKGKL